MSQDAEPIQRRMEAIRGQLDHDVEDVVRSAKRMVDWRVHVSRHPWAAVGLAAAVGYFVVPKRVEVTRLDAHALLDLDRRKQLVVEPGPTPHTKGGVAGKLVSFVTHAAVRGALAYLAQRIGKVGGEQAGQASSEEAGFGHARRHP